MKLTRPLLCFDFETTGINPSTDRIWQVGLVKIYPDGTEKEWESLVNPGVPIPLEVMEATRNDIRPNGVTNEELVNAPMFKELAPMLIKGFSECDLAGYNIRSFDIPLFEAECKRAGYRLDLSDAKILDAFKLYLHVRPRNLTSFVEDMTGDKDFARSAHDAIVDARGTWKAIQACLARYPLLPQTLEELHNMLFGQHGDSIAGGSFYFQSGDVFVNFGKYRNQPLKKIVATDAGYIAWCLGPKGNFSPEVRKIFEDALKGVYPVRKP